MTNVRRVARAAAVALVLLLVSNTAPAQAKRAPHTMVGASKADTAKVQKTVWALEQKWLDALNQRDQPALDALLAPEFTGIGIEGKSRTRAQALASVLDTTRPPLTRTIGRLDLKVYGDCVLAQGLTIVNGDKIREAHIAYTHAWILKNGKWEAVVSQENLQSF